MQRSLAIAVFILLSAMFSSAHAQFQPGQFVTWSQDAWGGDPAVPGSAAALVSERFFFVYQSGGVLVGATTSMLFTAPQAVVSYLPTSGANAPLSAVLVDPTSTSAGALGGHVLALQLDVDFADAGYLAGSAGAPFGDLTLVNMSSVADGLITRNYSAYEGLTVRQFRDQMNVAIGSGVAAYSFDSISYLTEVVTRAFEGGQPSQFAQDHLRIVPEPTAGALALLGLFAARRRRKRC